MILSDLTILEDPANERRPAHWPDAASSLDPTAQGSLQSDALSWPAAAATDSRTGQTWPTPSDIQGRRGSTWAGRGIYQQSRSRCVWCSQTMPPLLPPAHRQHHTSLYAGEFNVPPDTILVILQAVFYSQSLDWHWQTKQYRKLHKLSTTQKYSNTSYLGSDASQHSATKWNVLILQHSRY